MPIMTDAKQMEDKKRKVAEDKRNGGSMTMMDKAETRDQGRGEED